MSVYFIRLQDFLHLISDGRMPRDFAFTLDRACPLYRQDETSHIFSLVRNDADVPDHMDRKLLFIRYEQCFQIMHCWLEQLAAWQKAHGLHISSISIDTRSDLDGKKLKNLKDLFFHVLKLEIACRDASLPTAHAEYIIAAGEISGFLYESGLLFRTLLRSDHPLSRLENFPLASFVFEGYILLDQNVFLGLRRPFVQMHVILPRFNALLRGETPESLEARAEANAAALLQEEEAEAHAAEKKRTAKKQKRERRRAKAQITKTPAEEPTSRLRAEAPAFFPANAFCIPIYLLPACYSRNLTD